MNQYLPPFIYAHQQNYSPLNVLILLLEEWRENLQLWTKYLRKTLVFM